MEVRVEKLEKRFGRVAALAGVTHTFPKGALTAVVGPSGCGKTTLLRVLAGFVRPDQGRVWMDGRDVTDFPPQARDCALVFQNYALWPHMTVFDNVAFGLRLRRLPSHEVRDRVREALALVELDRVPGIESRRPRELSGGQQQRVALARAIAVRPRLLLLDEPLSNLDAKVRHRVRVEIRALQRRTGITTVYVTHDQEEALSIADRLVVMWQGRVQQVGPPLEVYTRPATPFVADFVGTTNLLRAEVGEDGGVRWGDVLLEVAGPLLPAGPVLLAVRPERLRLVDGAAASQRNCVTGRVEAWTFFGPYVRLHVSANGELLAVDVPQEVLADAGLQRHAPVTVHAVSYTHLTLPTKRIV